MKQAHLSGVGCIAHLGHQLFGHTVFFGIALSNLRVAPDVLSRRRWERLHKVGVLGGGIWEGPFLQKGPSLETPTKTPTL